MSVGSHLSEAGMKHAEFALCRGLWTSPSTVDFHDAITIPRHDAGLNCWFYLAWEWYNTVRIEHGSLLWRLLGNCDILWFSASFFYRSFGCGFSTTLLGYARASPGYLTSQVLISTSRIISPRFGRDPSPPSRVLAVLEARICPWSSSFPGTSSWWYHRYCMVTVPISQPLRSGTQIPCYDDSGVPRQRSTGNSFEFLNGLCLGSEASSVLIFLHCLSISICFLYWSGWDEDV